MVRSFRGKNVAISVFPSGTVEGTFVSVFVRGKEEPERGGGNVDRLSRRGVE